MLKIQTPGSKMLLHELNRAAKDAKLGGGAFAFATRSGVKKFFSQSNIKNLAKNGEFLLIVGIDAVTNYDTIRELEKQTQELKGLTVNVFLHTYNSTFHPKLSWYKSKNSVSLVVGSGNMTSAGLGKSADGGNGNWEAFYTRRLSQKDAGNIIKVWQDWITDCRNNGYLHTIDSKQVLEKAAENSRCWPQNVSKKSAKEPKKTTKPVAINIEGSEYSNQVRISEISKNRPGQLDIGKNILRDFFGYTSNTSDHKILIQNVNLDNTLDNPERRLPFKNRSQNYRFELNGLKVRNYIPNNDNRPVVIFIKLGRYVYRYCILMYGDQNYADIIKMLGQKGHGKGRKMRKLDTSIEKLRKSAPNLPDQLYPILEQSDRF